MTWTLAQSTRARVSPNKRARAMAKVRTTRAKDSPKATTTAKAQEKAVPKNNENSKSDRKCFVCGKTVHVAQDCDHRVRTVNEVTKQLTCRHPCLQSQNLNTR